MPDEVEKNRYSTSDMLETAKRLRSAGVSPRSGRKLKRRSVQPSRERQQVLKVILIVGIVVTALVAGVATWWLTKNQQQSKSGPAFELTPPTQP